MKIVFPPVEQADENGIVWIGGELSMENLLSAYSQGIFPWPHQGLPLLWFCPEARGILPFASFHIPRSVSRDLKKQKFSVSFDTCFARVMEACAQQKRTGSTGTWITAEMKKIYSEMHERGHAHSVECWQGDTLVGGLYGVYIEGVFSGESMFHHVTGASKQCLISLVDQLKKMGHDWFDIQMVTPVLESFGGTYLSRPKYLELLKQTQSRKLVWRIYEDR